MQRFIYGLCLVSFIGCASSGNSPVSSENAPNSVNTSENAPIINISAESTYAAPGTSIRLLATATDNQTAPSSLTYAWKKLEGPNAVSFENTNAHLTTANFSQEGVYRIQVSSSDGEQSSSNEIKITIHSDAPNSFCGNRAVDSFEQCDDGNRTNGDSCSSICQIEGDNFPVSLYQADAPPPFPKLEDLPLLSQITQHGITWRFSEAERVGRFVNGDYYVVGSATIISMSPTPGNGRHQSMLNILPNVQRSGFDSRIVANRYDASLAVLLPVQLTPGNRLVSSRSLTTLGAKDVLRPDNAHESPVASFSILTSVSEPQPLDAFRPSYGDLSNRIYLSRNLKRSILPQLEKVTNMASLSEFTGYMKRPWVDTLFYSYDVATEYMPHYGRDDAYMMSFVGLLLTVNFTAAEKEPLLVYATQYGIDLYGMVRAGHTGWPAQGGHGSGRKFPIVLAGTMLGLSEIKNLKADFGEDMQTIWVEDTPPAGTFTFSWHRNPVKAVFAGYAGVNGNSLQNGYGPFEHLRPSQWVNLIGSSYQRCCTSVGWAGEALAARLIPGMVAMWNHEPFFAYVDRWMTPEDPQDLAEVEARWGATIDIDMVQGTASGVLAGGHYLNNPQFLDQMWIKHR